VVLTSGRPDGTLQPLRVLWSQSGVPWAAYREFRPIDLAARHIAPRWILFYCISKTIDL
jgi:hypothetical protein